MDFLKKLIELIKNLLWPKPPQPPEPPMPPTNTVDEIDPSQIIWDEPAGNVGKWPITVKITEAAVTASKIKFKHGQLIWPAIQREGWDKPARGNIWIIGLCQDNRYHAATCDWLLDQQEIDQLKWDGADDLHGRMSSDFRPQSGTEAAVMLSTFARGGIWTITERSQIVKVRWP